MGSGSLTGDGERGICPKGLARGSRGGRLELWHCDASPLCPPGTIRTIDDIPEVAINRILSMSPSDITEILQAVEQGSEDAAQDLFPIVYSELQALARSRMAAEAPGQTLQPTALVHEAWLRLLGPGGAPRNWKSRGQFFAAAAEAMRRILVDQARQKQTLKRGGHSQRRTLSDTALAMTVPADDILQLDDALEQLRPSDSQAVEVAKLRLFGGLSFDEIAETLDLSRSSAHRQWMYVRAWLWVQLRDGDESQATSPG